MLSQRVSVLWEEFSAVEQEQIEQRYQTLCAEYMALGDHTIFPTANIRPAEKEIGVPKNS